MNNDNDNNNNIDIDGGETVQSVESNETVGEKNDLENLKKEIEELRLANEEYLAGWKRAKADYLNLEAQAQKRLSNALESELAGVILKFLTIYETFAKALKHFDQASPDSQKGLEAAVGEFWKILEDAGIEKIKTEGTADPNLHDVLLKQKQEGFDSGMIIQEVAAGYMLNGKLLKAAKVIVAE